MYTGVYEHTRGKQLSLALNTHQEGEWILLTSCMGFVANVCRLLHHCLSYVTPFGEKGVFDFFAKR